MSKKARKEANRVASLIKSNKAEYYITDTDLGDNSNDVLSAAKNVNKSLGKFKSAFMILSAGKTKLTVVVYVPNELSDKIDLNEWTRKSLIGLTTASQVMEDMYVITTIESDRPFKLIDTVRGNGFAHLNRTGCIEEESSEEFVGFDDI